MFKHIVIERTDENVKFHIKTNYVGECVIHNVLCDFMKQNVTT